MLFNSLEFVAFAALFFPIWALLRRHRLRLPFLVVASFFFYGFWDWRLLFLLIASGLVDFVAALAMARFPSARRPLLVASLSTNLGLLAAFKYSGLMADAANEWAWLLGSDRHFSSLALALPPGISFYTFQSMSYTIDVYRGRLKATSSLIDFFAFLSMFPQLVAGPIVRAEDLLPQLRNDNAPDEQEQWMGWSLIAQGFFKKCVIADNLAPAVNEVFAHIGATSSCATLWLASAMFAFQIYYDFSGYSDVACGLGRLMGYTFPANFDHPYASRSFREFWTRWHISLSTWFRDYLYIPLGGNAVGPLRSQANLWCTMLLSGLWHGASWTFVAWGAYHAAMLSLERALKRVWRALALPSPGWLTLPLVFALTLISWVFFRAPSLVQAVVMLRGMFDPRTLHLPIEVSRSALVALSVAVAWELASITWDKLNLAQLKPRWVATFDVAVPALLFIAAVYLRGPGTAFIYFQF